MGRDSIPSLFYMDIIIREANPADAAQIVAYVNRLSEEPNSNIELSPGEFSHTVESEAALLADFAASGNSIFLVAEHQGQIIGLLTCRGGSRKAIRHAALLGMSVDQAWRGQGIGSQLIARVIAWAKGTGILTRIELAVFERNTIAVHLYQKFGFEIEGKRRKAVFRDGAYLDGLLMALLLE